MPDEINILFIWLFLAVALGAVFSVADAYVSAREQAARERVRAARIAQQQPQRRRRRVQPTT